MPNPKWFEFARCTTAATESAEIVAMGGTNVIHYPSTSVLEALNLNMICSKLYHDGNDLPIQMRKHRNTGNTYDGYVGQFQFPIESLAGLFSNFAVTIYNAQTQNFITFNTGTYKQGLTLDVTSPLIFANKQVTLQLAIYGADGQGNIDRNDTVFGAEIVLDKDNLVHTNVPIDNYLISVTLYISGNTRLFAVEIYDTTTENFAIQVPLNLTTPIGSGVPSNIYDRSVNVETRTSVLRMRSPVRYWYDGPVYRPVVVELDYVNVQTVDLTEAISTSITNMGYVQFRGHTQQYPDIENGGQTFELPLEYYVGTQGYTISTSNKAMSTVTFLPGMP